MPHSHKLRDEFKRFVSESKTLDIEKDSADFVEIADWWLQKLSAREEDIRKAVEGLVEKHKEQACVISDSLEYDPVNMANRVENPIVRSLIFQHIDTVRELDEVLTLLKP